jgi:3-oxoacyl-[acyl-carrier-protein] synthase II
MSAGTEAMEQAGLAQGGFDPDRAGAIIGVGLGGILQIDIYKDVLRERGPRRVGPFFVPSLIANMAPGQLSLKFNLRGPNWAPASACASGTHAIGEAMETIRRDRCDLMLAGGAESAMVKLCFAGFCSMRALSTRNDDPEHASRPFDKERDGFIMGEGAGVLVLEELEHARRRGADIICELIGYGASADAHHITAPPPEGEGAQRCMREALRMAALSPSDVDYVNAHGTSTPLNDLYETQALKAVFGAHAEQLWVSSTKSMIGHLLGAAGGVEAVVTALTIRRGQVHPTRNLLVADPECDLDYVVEGAREKPIKTAISNSFGFGGTNGSLLLRRFED